MRRIHRSSQWGSIALAAIVATGVFPRTIGAPDKVAYLGVVVTQADDTLRNQVKLPRGAGLNVMEVVPESPADKSGIKPHDVLEKLDDQLLFNGEQLSALVRSRDPGAKITLTLVREGSRQRAEVTLGETEAPEPPKPPFEDFTGPFRNLGRFFKDMPDRFRWEPFLGDKGKPKPFPYLGVELGPVEPALAAQLGLDEGRGALVNTVIEGSPADKAGIKQHDVIVKIDGETPQGPADLSKRIREHKKGDKIELELFRGGKKMEIEATLAEQASPEPQHFRDALKSLKELQYRVVPRVRVFQGAPGELETVIELEDDTDEAAPVAKRRTKVYSPPPRPPAPGRPRALAPSGGQVPKAPEPPAPPKPPHQKRVIVIKTDKDTTTVREENGQRFVTVKDAQDHVLFDGPVGSDADREQLPAQVRDRLDRIERDLENKARDGLLEDEVRELRIPTPPLPPGVI